MAATTNARPSLKLINFNIPTVDDIVNRQVYYLQLCEEQSVIFRRNADEYHRAFKLYTQSEDVMQPGQLATRR